MAARLEVACVHGFVMIQLASNKAGVSMSACSGLNETKAVGVTRPPAQPMTPYRYRMLAWAVIIMVALMAIAETVCFLEISQHQAEQNGVRQQNRATRQLLQYLIDAETGVRGYVITRKPEFLEPYYSGLRAMEALPSERLSELDIEGQVLGKGKRTFNATLSGLRTLWASEVEAAGLAGVDHTDTERAMVEGKAAMDALRLRITRIMDQRDGIVANLDRSMSTERTGNLVLILAGTITAIGAVTYAFDRSIRDAVRRDRAVRNGEEASRRTRLLSSMTEMLQSAADRDDANEVLRASATHLMPGVAGALYVFNNSRDRLDLSTRWPGTEAGEPEFSPDHLSPSSCWALKRGKPHRNHVFAGALRCTHCSGEGPSLEIPMAARGELYGLLQLTAHGAGADERLDDLQEVAGSLADNMSLALSSIALREQLRNQALRDPLTGLYNRRFMEEMLVRFTQEAGRRQSPTSAVMIDLDHFKLLNDQYGHPAGDKVLRHVANTIASLVRPVDVTCRIGGEELLILMPDCDLATAEAKAEHLRTAIASLSTDGSTPPVTASFGVASRPETTARGEDLLPHADAALYAAKSKGRNTVVVSPLRQSTPALVLAEGR